MFDQIPRRYARCCRWWPVIALAKIGRCGLCGEIPTINLDFSKDDYEAWRSEHAEV